MEEFKLAFVNYLNFNGRSTRREYWMFTLFFYIIFILLCALSLIHDDLIILAFIYLAISIIPNLSISVRRLHDVNKSGWFLLLHALPLGGIVILIFACFESDPTENKWGKPPSTQLANTF